MIAPRCWLGGEVSKSGGGRLVPMTARSKSAVSHRRSLSDFLANHSRLRPVRANVATAGTMLAAVATPCSRGVVFQCALDIGAGDHHEADPAVRTPGVEGLDAK